MMYMCVYDIEKMCFLNLKEKGDFRETMIPLCSC